MDLAGKVRRSFSQNFVPAKTSGLQLLHFINTTTSVEAVKSITHIENSEAY